MLVGKTDPHRRLRQHNGDLKAGGAKRTQRSGRPWEFVAIMNGFPNQRVALQFEWAWQHGSKSLAVRHAIGDREAKAMAQKQGVHGKLAMLKTLISECETLCCTNQVVFFFDDLNKTAFDEIRTKSGTSLPSKVSTQRIKSMQEMPFWNDRGKKKSVEDNHECGDNDNDSEEDISIIADTVAQLPEPNPSILASRRSAVISLLTSAFAAATFTLPTYAVQEDAPPLKCNDECLAKRKRIIDDRRAMMRQSKSTTRRQDMFDLSRQRAALYNTTYQGAACLPNIPCL